MRKKIEYLSSKYFTDTNSDESDEYDFDDEADAICIGNAVIKIYGDKK